MSNPWAPESWNVTEQGRVVRERGMGAAQAMAKEAGTRIGATRPKDEVKQKVYFFTKRIQPTIIQQGGGGDGSNIFVEEGAPPDGGVVGQTILVGEGEPE